MANVTFVGGEVGGSRRGEIFFADLNGVGEENEKNGQQVSIRKDVKEGGRLLSSFTIVEIERGEVQSCLQRPSSHVGVWVVGLFSFLSGCHEKPLVAKFSWPEGTGIYSDING